LEKNQADFAVNWAGSSGEFLQVLQRKKGYGPIFIGWGFMKRIGLRGDGDIFSLRRIGLGKEQ